MEQHFPVNAQFIDTFFPTIDGVVRTVHNYAEIMNKDSYSCVVTPASRVTYTDAFSYDVIRTKSIGLVQPEYTTSLPLIESKLRKLINEKQFRILHTHSPFSMGEIAIKAGKQYGIPVVATFHSKYYDDILAITKSKVIAKEVTRKLVRVYSQADSVWAVSRGTADTLHSYGYEGDIFVINNGTDYVYPSDPSALRRKAAITFGLQTDKPLLLFVGHQIWQKNLRLMLDTAKVLADSGFEFTFAIVGKGYAAEAIRQYAESLGLVPRCVRFLGQIEDKELLKGVMLCSDLFFFMSVYDNAPLVVREAAAMKLPSLLAAGSNAAEAVTDGENGYVSKTDAIVLTEKVRKIFADREKLSAVGIRAAETVGVPWAKIMPVVKEKYLEIIENYSPK